MARIFWNPLKTLRTKKALASYNRAITMAMKRGLTEEQLPPKMTFADIQSIVGEDNAMWRKVVGYASDARRGRPSYLDRALKKYRPDALEVNPETGFTYFVERENKRQYAQDLEAAIKSRARHEEYTGKRFEDMSRAEELATVVNTDMVIPEEESYRTGEDIYDHLYGELSHRAESKYLTYLEVWGETANFHSSMEGYEALIEAMEWLKDNRPDVLETAFNSNDPEAQIDFVYISPRADINANIGHRNRHERAVTYWVDLAKGAGMTNPVKSPNEKSIPALLSPFEMNKINRARADMGY